jgi:small subunit ribosomal protein S20
MPNLPSAKKHVRADARKSEQNRRVKSAMRTALKKARAGIAAQDANAQETLRRAISQLDKAAKKGVIRKGNADRRKSRLMRAFHQASA